jgi:hypothetical protein
VKIDLTTSVDFHNRTFKVIFKIILTSLKFRVSKEKMQINSLFT